MLFVNLICDISKDKDKFMRILGITLPDNKRMEMALTALYGVGRSRAQQILDKAGIDYGKIPKDLTQDEENGIRKIVESYKIEGDLKREIGANVKRLKDIKTYRGIRHIKKLPVKGQRTKTNSRTVRGNVRKTMGSGRKKEEKT
ncbi:MAG: 30S ribosomal protein S13 [Patescibacteria group bacterium]|nr:30S ribosomal protein S13 [Patescibacteria group bacterium]